MHYSKVLRSTAMHQYHGMAPSVEKEIKLPDHSVERKEMSSSAGK